ncbi:MAG: hypothetical protein JSS09_09375, partial [Verrucomicrobia bacterium]|nr:hypothetical protein [Verrucomicrobiota bacterium]
AIEKNPPLKSPESCLLHKKTIDTISILGLLSGKDLIRPSQIKHNKLNIPEGKLQTNTLYWLTTKPKGSSEDSPKQMIALLKSNNYWERYTPFSGHYHIALVSDTSVIKIGKDPESYKKEQANLDKIYSRIGNANVGIQKRIPKEDKNLDLFFSKQQPVIECYHKEHPYEHDLKKSLTKKKVTQETKINYCRLLIAGSKKFIDNGIYHLDTKPANIGCLKDGGCEHFDFGGSFIIDKHTGMPSKDGIVCSRLTLPNDRAKLLELINGSDSKEALFLLEKIHIFQLGSCFYFMQTLQTPYGHTLDKKKIASLHPTPTLKRNLLFDHEMAPKHVSVILKMLSNNPKNRPSIDEVELAFQKTAHNSNNNSCCTMS